MNYKAATIIIGNEVLSGSTQDINMQEIAIALSDIGIELEESRTIKDEKKVIVDCVRELSNKYDYVFTTGGIGPTHDDITADAIAEAFRVPCVCNQTIYKILQEYSDIQENISEESKEAKFKMAYIPQSAELIFNEATIVPGFITENVYSFAGTPDIMRSMLAASVPMLTHGVPIKSKSIRLLVYESSIAKMLGELQSKYTNVSMGSYPFVERGKHGTKLVMRSSNYEQLENAYTELKNNLSSYPLNLLPNS